MLRSSIIAALALAVGILIGWKARYFAADGHDGIQWRFNDAAGRGDLGEMKRLISAGADPLAYPSYADGAVTGSTPLFEAASEGEPEAVEFLLSQGADVNAIEATETPLDMAEYRRSQADRAIAILKVHGAKNLQELSSQVKTKTEQAGAGQPATRPESKLEGSDKPQPEAEGRSR